MEAAEETKVKIIQPGGAKYSKEKANLLEE